MSVKKILQYIHDNDGMKTHGQIKRHTGLGDDGMNCIFDLHESKRIFLHKKDNGMYYYYISESGKEFLEFMNSGNSDRVKVELNWIAFDSDNPPEKGEYLVCYKNTGSIHLLTYAPYNKRYKWINLYDTAYMNPDYYATVNTPGGKGNDR